MVGEALKGGRLVAEVLAREGFAVAPAPGPCDPWSFITAGTVALQYVGREGAPRECGHSGAKGRVPLRLLAPFPRMHTR